MNHPDWEAPRWYTAARPAEEVAEPWLLYPLFMPGALTILGGEPKLAGKSFLVTSLLRGMLSNEEFAGQSSVWAPVVYLTEQPPSSFRATMAQTGILGQEEFHYIHNYQMAKMSWAEKVEEIEAKASREAARYVVVDTFANCVGLKGEEENSAGGTIRAALQPMQDMAARLHAGVCILHHMKKGTDEETNIVNAFRGHSAMSDVADILAGLRNTSTSPRHPSRLLEAVGRYGDLPADPLQVLYRDGRYIEVSRTHRHDITQRLWEALPEKKRFTKEEFNETAQLVGCDRNDAWWGMREWQREGRIKTLSPGLYRRLA